MRVRFAPSPTGYLHIGNARTAVINYIIAKKYNAEYIIRIEDTDKERSTKESEISILQDLKWLGINWTEGPDMDKGHGPYRQSERDHIYKEYTDRLLKSGHGFRCFCSREQVEEDKAKAMAENKPFHDRCRNMPLAEQERLAAEGKEFTVKFKVPENTEISFDDKIKGTVTFNSDNIGGDFIIVRSDGGPVYNYIVIIDDALMEVTHVIRGEDHLSNTPKQILIAKALDLPVPEYAHLPLILGSDKKKLSKRHGITSVDLYKQEGYLPEALMNYLGLLGWSTESGEELLEFERLVELFELENIGKSPAVFDFQKLKWMNGAYLKKYPLDKVTEMFIPYIKAAGFETLPERSKLEDIISALRNSCEILSDISKFIGIFLNEINEPDEETDSHLKEDYAIDIIKICNELIEQIAPDEISSFISKVKEKSPHKGKKLFHPIRAIVTGRLSGPELDIVIPIIGFDKLKKRIKYAYSRYC
jgi:glutamyl-tRNA synthetase